MRRFYIFILANFLSLVAVGQCLTDLKKVLPKRTSGKDLGSSQVATGGDFLVVANFQDDTTGYINNGAAYVFQRSAAGWNYEALLKPSNASNQQSFGYRVDMDSLGESISVIAFGWYPGSSEVYIYQKPNSGWTDAIEFDRIKLQDTLVNATVARFSSDGLTLVIGQSQELEYGIGLLYVFKRSSLSEKFSDKIPFIVNPPDKYHSFGADVAVNGNYIAASAEYVYNMGFGAIFIYKNDSQNNYPLLATLTADQSTATFGQSFKMKGNTIAARGLSSNANGNDAVICMFEKKQGTIWSDTISAKLLPMPDWNTDIEILDSLTIAFGADPVLQSGFTFSSDKEIVGTITKLGSSWSKFRVDTIYQETLPKGGSVSRAFRNNLNSISWNGAQLIVVPTLDSPNSKFVNSITSITRSNGVWGSIMKLKFPNVNNYKNLFGYSIIKAGQNLIVSNPQDSELAPYLGSVKIFTKDSNQIWAETNSIQSPFGNSIDRHFFANTLSACDSMLAVGAVNYGENYSGEVYLYKRTGSDWNSLSAYQKVKPSQDISYSFGSSLGISSKVLAVSGFSRTLGGGTNNAMDIFEKGPNGYNFVKTVDFGNAWSHGQNSKIFVRNDSIFAFSGLGGYSGSATGVFIITKDPITKIWSMISSFDLSDQDMASASIFDFNEITLEVSEDHVFVGVPGLPLGNALDVGRVFVYSKLPGTKWPAGSIQHSSVIYPKDTVAFGYFGYALANSENTLVIGAPGTDNKLVSSYPYQWFPRNQSGATYVFTAQNYYWKNATQLLKLQGTQYNKPLTDHMGLAVASDSDFYFSGAPYESNDHGSQAGAVYTIPTPPLVKLIAPMCQGSPPQKLFGYPFGGIWSGQGLVSGSNGVFDPNLVGPGKYLLSYKTPNCAYEGKLLLEVIGSPSIQLLTPSSLSICPTNPPVIKIQPIDSATYQWYYRALNGTTDSKIANQIQPQLTVGLSGYYYCLVTKGSCSFPSSIVTVQYETPSASIGPQSVVCDLTKVQNLIATPTGGTWSGQGIVSASLGTFSPLNLANGKHPITYTFKSGNGCNYTLADTVLIDAIPKQAIIKVPGDYCLTGLVDLKVDPIAPSLTYSWNFSKDPNSTPQIIDALSQQDRTFVEAGYYQVIVSNKNCSVSTDKLMVGLDNDLPVTITPSDSLISVCLLPTTTLTALSSRSGVNFEWYYKGDSKGDSAIAGGEPSFIATKSGFYKVHALLGFCESSSKWQHVKFLPPDSLFVPNVFTPNGDSYNDDFHVNTTLADYSMLVLNRYGQEIFTSQNSNPPWSGGEHPAGVYYWYVEYFDCSGKERTQKGFVQLIR